MRISIVVISMLLAAAVLAAPQINYDYALGKTPVGTFSNPQAATDGQPASYAQSGNVVEAPQFLTFDLGANIYVGSVKIVWDQNALSRDYSVRVSKDGKSWFSEFSNLDASSAPVDAATGNASQIISTQRYTIPSRYVQIYLPVGSSATAPKVRIAQVQILPAQNLRFSFVSANAYPISQNRAIVVYRTSIGAASGQVLYGRDPNNLDRIATNLESGAVNSATLTKLDPDYVHFYKIKAWDASGNVVESPLYSFRPLKTNLALGKRVTGTFTKLPPNDPLVDRSTVIINRTVDGLTSYFKGMATSGSLRASDQELIVDLGSVYPLTSVVSYWRALAYPESFSIQVSSDRSAWKEVATNIDAGQGAFARSDTGDPMRVINIDAEGTEGRYIQIKINKNSPYFVKHADWDFVQLMEVEVFGR